MGKLQDQIWFHLSRKIRRRDGAEYGKRLYTREEKLHSTSSGGIVELHNTISGVGSLPRNIGITVE